MPKRDVVRRIDQRAATGTAGGGGSGAASGNADTVDGIHASRTPTANTLLALNGSGLFPLSVLPPIGLDDLSDVTIDGVPDDNEFLAFDTVAGGWLNQTAAEVGLIAGTLGNLTASGAISIDQARQVVGGAAVISHATTAGNIHLPTGGSANQLLKNSGTSGAGAWGTVTESSGVLGAVTAIRPASDSTTALRLQNAAGSATVLTVDTSTNAVGVGLTPAAQLDVLLADGQTNEHPVLRVRGGTAGAGAPDGPMGAPIILTAGNGGEGALLSPGALGGSGGDVTITAGNGGSGDGGYGSPGVIWLYPGTSGATRGQIHLAPGGGSIYTGETGAAGCTRMYVNGGLAVGGTSDPGDNNLLADGTITGTRLISNIAIGTAPIDVTSTTRCANLNADLLDGVEESALLLAAGTRTGASSSAQTFTLGIIGPSWKPAADSTTALQMQNAAGTTVLNADTTNMRIGIGTTPSHKLDVAGTTNGTYAIRGLITSNTDGAAAIRGTLTFTATSGSAYGNVFTTVDSPTAHSGAVVHGIYGNVSTSSDAYNRSTLYGIRFQAQSNSTGTLSYLTGAWIFPYLNAAGTVTHARGLYTYPWMAAGTYTNWTGLYIDNDSLGSGAITNEYGIYINDIDAGGTLNYAVYTGKGLNRLGDQLSVVGSSDRVQMSITGHTTQTANLVDFIRNDAYYNTANTVLRLVANTTGTPTNGLGARLLFGIESSTTASLDAGAIEASAVEVSWASRKNKLSFFANDYGGSRLGLEIEATGTAAILKSFGTHTTTGRRRAVVTKTADYTAAATDEVIVCDKATAMTITLPAATGTGQWFAIGSIGAGAVTVDGSGADVIDGSATQVIYQYDTIQIVDYAAGAWKVI